jgi:hypothetical protein
MTADVLEVQKTGSHFFSTRIRLSKRLQKALWVWGRKRSCAMLVSML